MSCRSQRRGYPPQKPNFDKGIASLDDTLSKARCSTGMSLVEELGEVADDLRQIATELGARPYRVFSIVVGWSGGEIGRGDQTVLEETELLPTPYVDLSVIRYRVTSGGKTDDGVVKMFEISPRYTEDEVKALFSRELGDTEQQFVEIRLDARFGEDPMRHRLVLSGMPYHDATGFQWVVNLMIQQEERRRTGETSERTTVTTAHPLGVGGSV